MPPRIKYTAVSDACDCAICTPTHRWFCASGCAWYPAYVVIPYYFSGVHIFFCPESETWCNQLGGTINVSWLEDYGYQEYVAWKEIRCNPEDEPPWIMIVQFSAFDESCEGFVCSMKIRATLSVIPTQYAIFESDVVTWDQRGGDVFRLVDLNFVSGSGGFCAGSWGPIQVYAALSGVGACNVLPPYNHCPETP